MAPESTSLSSQKTPREWNFVCSILQSPTENRSGFQFESRPTWCGIVTCATYDPGSYTGIVLKDPMSQDSGTDLTLRKSCWTPTRRQSAGLSDGTTLFWVTGPTTRGPRTNGREEAYGVSEARRMKIPVVIEDARDERVLADLGVHKAQAVVAATDNDLANLEIALDARNIRPGIRVVVRMFDQQIAQKIARSFDIKLLFSTAAIAAPSFAAATIDRTLVNSFYIDDKQLQTVKLLIGAGSKLIGKSVGYLSENRSLSILSHRRHNQEAVLFPAPQTILQENDKVAVLAQAFVIGQLHELNAPVK